MRLFYFPFNNVLFCCFLFFLSNCVESSVTTITVNQFGAASDLQSDSTGVYVEKGNIDLRGALNYINKNPAAPGNSYLVNFGAGGIITPSSPLPPINLNATNKITIDGGSITTINGSYLHRGFFVCQATKDKPVVIQNLTLANCYPGGSAIDPRQPSADKASRSLSPQASLGGGVFVDSGCRPNGVYINNVTFLSCGSTCSSDNRYLQPNGKDKFMVGYKETSLPLGGAVFAHGSVIFGPPPLEAAHDGGSTSGRLVWKKEKETRSIQGIVSADDICIASGLHTDEEDCGSLTFAPPAGVVHVISGAIRDDNEVVNNLLRISNFGSPSGDSSVANKAFQGGSLVHDGLGTTILAGENTFSGGVKNKAGTVSIAANAALGKLDAPLTFAGDSALAITAPISFPRSIIIESGVQATIDPKQNTVILSGQVSGEGSLLHNPSSEEGSLVLTGNNTYSGGTSINSGTLAISSGSNLGTSRSFSFNGSGALRLMRAEDYTIPTIVLPPRVTGTLDIDHFTSILRGSIQGEGHLSIVGTGDLTFIPTEQSVHQGMMTIQNSTLRGGCVNAFSNQSRLNLPNQVGACFNLSNGLNQEIGSLVGGGVLGGRIILGTSMLTVGRDETSPPEPFAGLIEGSGGLIKVGAGKCCLSGKNSYTGGTQINEGTIAISATHNLGKGGVVFTGDAILQLNAPATYTMPTIQLHPDVTGIIDVKNSESVITSNIQGEGSLIVDGDASLILNPTEQNEYSGKTIIQSNALKAGRPNAFSKTSQVYLMDHEKAAIHLNGFDQEIGSLAGGGSNGGAVLLGENVLTIGGDNSSSVFSGSISGTGGITKVGSGIFVLDGTKNSYTGVTTIQSGVIQSGSPQALSSTSRIYLVDEPGVTLDLNGFDQTVGSLTGGGLLGGHIDLNSNTLTVGVDNSSPEAYSGLLRGSGGLVKTGTGILTLSGTNSYSGATKVHLGTLRAGAKNTFSNVSQVALGNNPGAVLDLNGYNQEIGSLTGGGDAGGDVKLGSSLLTLGSDHSSPAAFSGSISGAGGGIVKVGRGILTVSGVNTYSGPTVVAGGIVQSGAEHAFSKTSQVHLVDNPGVGLHLNGFDQEIGSLVGGGENGGDVALGGNTLTIGRYQYSSPHFFSGSISGDGGNLVKVGGGTFTLCGSNNTYNGVTCVYEGGLCAGASNAFSKESQVYLANSPDAILDLNGYDQEIGSLVGGGSRGGNVLLGSNTLTIGGDNTPTTLFEGSISGENGSVHKIGEGTCILSGSHSYTGPTVVRGGALILQGDLMSPVIVEEGTLFKGVGRNLAQLTVNQGGVLHPGNSIGSMVVGALQLNPGAVLNLELEPGSDLSSTILVQNSAELNGTLNLIQDSGFYNQKQSYNFITVEKGKISGGFNEITNVPAGFSAEVNYAQPGIASLLLTLTGNPINDPTLTGNRRTIVNQTDFWPSFSNLATLSSQQVAVALDSISPARNGGVTYIANQGSFEINATALQRMSMQRVMNSGSNPSITDAYAIKYASLSVMAEEPNTDRLISSDTSDDRLRVKTLKFQNDRYSLWANGFGNFLFQEGENQNPNINATTAGAVVGFDYQTQNHIVMTALAGYINNSLQESDNAGSAHTSGGVLALYQTAPIDNWYVELGALGGYSHFNINRNIKTPTFVSTAKSEFNAWQAAFHLGGGYDFMHNWGIIEPFAAVGWSITFQPGYTESGADPFNVRSRQANPSMLQSQIGLNAYETWDKETFTCILQERVSYLNKVPFGTNVTAATVTTAPANLNWFTVQSYSNVLNLFEIGAEIFYKHKKSGLFLSAAYGGEFGSGYVLNNINGTLGFFF